MRTVLDITDDQLSKVAPLLHSLEPGGSIIAQVYADGIRCKLLSPDQTIAVQGAIGTADMTALHSSAFEAEKYYSERTDEA